MTKAERFYERHIDGDQEAIPEAIDEAVMVHIDGEPSDRRDDLGDALANDEQLKLFFSDLSLLELRPLSRGGLFVGWGQ